jgi:hypothetical protein
MTQVKIVCACGHATTFVAELIVIRNARSLHVYKIFRRYTFFGQRYYINEDIVKEFMQYS